MDKRQQLLIRNVVAGLLLLVFLFLALMWLGVFEGEESDEAQIRELISTAQDNINEKEWDDLFRLGDMTPQRAREWEDSLPRLANVVKIHDIRPKQFIDVPAGATEYDVVVVVTAMLDPPMNVPGVSGTREVNEGTMYFVKVDDEWKIDFDRSTGTFPHVSAP